ncbi:MAG TPA: HD-GYP domain-containing protein [Nitrospirae bacterium]|nr:HD-GYP domain-containing protein [Nitrospirota bacterium]
MSARVFVRGLVMAFQRIESIHDIRTVAFVDVSGSFAPVFKELIARFRVSKAVYKSESEALSGIPATQADIAFIGPFSTDHSIRKLSHCQQLRSSGYHGVIILLTEEISSFGGTSGITAAGFDHYLLDSDIDAQLEDSVNWAILNRRRKNKYTLQFDNNPDALFTVDSEGRVFDINQWGTDGSGLSPKMIVVGAVNVMELGTLDCFESLIRPLIVEGNAGKTFMNSVNEGERVFQVQCRVHDVSMIGLVATVVKTDITETMYTRSMDILINSVNLLSERDNYTAGHSSRVYHYCRLISQTMGITGDKKFIRDLYFAALLHDIGKIGVRDYILLKKGPLTDQEHEVLCSHSEKGFKILQNYQFLEGSIGLVLSHHERPDGKGYPQKLISEKIPFGASIISVADGFDAMTTTRPYRKPLKYEKALAEIRDNIGTQYDPDVANAFLSTVRRETLKEATEKSTAGLSALSNELIESLL